MYIILFIATLILSIFFAFKNKEFFQNNVFNMISNKINIDGHHDKNIKIKSSENEELKTGEEDKDDLNSIRYINNIEPKPFNHHLSNLKSIFDKDNSLKNFSDLVKEEHHQEEHHQEEHHQEEHHHEEHHQEEHHQEEHHQEEHHQEEHNQEENNDNYTLVYDEKKNYTKGQEEEEDFIKKDMSDVKDILKTYKNLGDLIGYNKQEESFQMI